MPSDYVLIDKAKVELEGDSDDRFEVEGSFVLETSIDGIDVLNEDVTVEFGSFSQTIPGGSFFRDDDDEGFQFDGAADGLKRVQLRDDGDFKVKGDELDLLGIDLNNPVPFSLQIGNDFGETEILFDAEGKFEANPEPSTFALWVIGLIAYTCSRGSRRLSARSTG